MAETEKLAEVLLTTAVNGTGPPKNSEGETITKKTDDKDNGAEKAAAGETGTHEEKDGDVKMMDVTDVKIGEQDKEGDGGEVELVKGKVEVTTAVNGTGPPKNSGGEAITEKTDDKGHGAEKAAVGETRTHEEKDEDVKMTDVTDVKIGEQDEEGNGGEVELVKEKEEEKEMTEIKDASDAPAEEYNAAVKGRNKKDHDKTENAGGKSDGAEAKSKRHDEEKCQGFAEKGEETPKGEESEDEGEETEEKGQGFTEKGEETQKGEESEDEGEEIVEKGLGFVEKGEETQKCEESEDEGEETVEKGDGAEEESKGFDRKRTEENEEGGTRTRRGEGKGKKEGGKAKGVLRSPTPSSIDRPVRERRTVERLVEVVEKEPSKAFLIEKGQGTPLKDIPNVAYKLSKKRPADIKSLHQLLFGRKGKAINFKSHIFQFSGFVWHENEDKRRAKVKDKLDKCVKDKLLDMCNVFDIPVSRATSRKEDLVGKLLDFMVAPHATTDVALLAEKGQPAKSRKRKTMSGRGVSMKLSGKRTKSEMSKSMENTIDTEDEDEDGDTGEDKENGFSDKDESTEHSQSEEESEHDNAAKESEHSGKGGRGAKKSLKKQNLPAKTKKSASPKKRSQPTSIKSPRTSYSKHLKADEAKNSPKQVYRSRKNVVTPKKNPSSKSDIEVEKTSGKKTGSKTKTPPAENFGPTEKEMRQKVCEILKEVDFNTATFTDLLKRLASHYDMDMTARKASIKVMIQDELTKLADDDDDDSEDEADTEKAENSEPAGKEVEA